MRRFLPCCSGGISESPAAMRCSSCSQPAQQGLCAGSKGPPGPSWQPWRGRCTGAAREEPGPQLPRPEQRLRYPAVEVPRCHGAGIALLTARRNESSAVSMLLQAERCSRCGVKGQHRHKGLTALLGATALAAAEAQRTLQLVGLCSRAPSTTPVRSPEAIAGRCQGSFSQDGAPGAPEWGSAAELQDLTLLCPRYRQA